MGDLVHIGAVILSLFNGTSEWQHYQLITEDKDNIANVSNWTKYLDALADTDNDLSRFQFQKISYITADPIES